MQNKSKPIPEKNEKGTYYITKKYCCELSDYNGHSSLPQFISTLHLHFKAFFKIENLEAFDKLKILYLENNCISKIEGISHMKNLNCLYLNNNVIEDISGLESNTELRILNLSNNKIRYLPELKTLDKLQTLTLDNNLFEKSIDLKNISCLASISVLGLNENHIDDEVVDDNADLIDILKPIESLRVLYFKGNPLVRKIRNYRKKIIKELANLTYLDEKPVDECERLSTEAFWRGGLAEERKVRNEYRLQRDFGHRVREINKANPIDTQKKKEQAELSLKNEYLFKKATLKEKKQKLLEEYSTSEGVTKSNIFRELLSVDNQIQENERFKIEEIKDHSILVQRGDHVTKIKEFNLKSASSVDNIDISKLDDTNLFIFEDWMNKEFEYYLIHYMWNFSDAVDAFKFKFKETVKNINMLNERDLRIRWANMENTYLNSYTIETDNVAIHEITFGEKYDDSKYRNEINFEELD